MAFHQVKDIMRETCNEHVRVAEYYEEMQDFVAEAKVKSLLEIMYQHEQEMILGIRRYLKEGISSTLNTWFQYLPDIPKASELIKENLEEDITPEDLVHLINKVNQCFIVRYTKFSDICPSTAVKELFSEMIRMEENEGPREGWNQVMLEDM